ncbi:MAG: ATP-binding protein [Proteobacteria bacterium]|nr:ATP-binding protein [Pseudomonadota bacterium]
MNEKKRVLNEQTVEISLPNRLGYERVVMGSVAAFARSVGFVPSRIEDLKTAVAEACINAVQHGNKGRSDARVIVTMQFKEDVFHVSVFDEGEGAKKILKDPDIVRIMDNLDPPTGFGTFLMRQLMDEVEFVKTANHGHEVRMAIKLGGQSS